MEFVVKIDAGKSLQGGREWWKICSTESELTAIHEAITASNGSKATAKVELDGKTYFTCEFKKQKC